MSQYLKTFLVNIVTEGGFDHIVVGPFNACTCMLFYHSVIVFFFIIMPKYLDTRFYPQLQILMDISMDIVLHDYGRTRTRKDKYLHVSLSLKMV